jgi:hypothetical protein
VLKREFQGKTHIIPNIQTPYIRVAAIIDSIIQEIVAKMGAVTQVFTPVYEFSPKKVVKGAQKRILRPNTHHSLDPGTLNQGCHIFSLRYSRNLAFKSCQWC